MTKPKRNRRRQSGSIHKRKDGRWAATLDLGYVAGKRKRKTIYGKTKAEVDEKLTKLKNEQLMGLPVLDERRTVSDFLTSWLTGLRTEPLKQSTRQRYDEMVRLHLQPSLGRIRLVRLTPDHLLELYAAKLDSGLKPATVRHIHAVIRRALRRAEERGHVARNVAALVSPPRVEREEMDFLTEDEVELFLKSVRGDPFEALYVLAVVTGMREGELLGLRWSDINFDKGVVSVQRQIQRITGKGLVTSTPKTVRGRRSIPVPSGAIRKLRTHRAAQAKALLAIGEQRRPTDYVFTNALGGPIDASNMLHRSFKPLLARAKLRPIRFHDIRHTAITLWIASGIDAVAISRLAGHSSVAFTLDQYGHVFPSTFDRAAEVMGETLNRAAGAG